MWRATRYIRRGAVLGLGAVAVVASAALGQSAMEELVAVGDAHYQAEEWEAAATVYASLAAEDSTSLRTWYRLGLSQLQAEWPDKALVALRRADQLGGGIPIIKYQVARAQAAAGAEPWSTLTEAVGAGFSGIALLDTDPEWDTVRATEAFRDARAALDRAARPCEHVAEHRQFDFWVGTWDVYGAGGGLLGTNRIEKSQQGCALLEYWESAGGGTGMSINYYDSGSGEWVQKWVAPTRMSEYSGGLVGDEMRLRGTSRPIGTGNPVDVRGTWTPLPDGRVRQQFERSVDGGETWTQTFDGYYVRQTEGE